MANATQAQVSALEKALAEQFYWLVQAAAFRIGLARKFGIDGEPFLKFNDKFSKLVKSWVGREVKYERALIKKGIYGIIATGDLDVNDFFYSASLPKLDMLVKKWDAEPKTQQGTGFIPLLIWAAIALIGYFTVTEVVDDLTTTTQEKAELMESTKKTAQELGLTPEQAAGIISQTQAEASQGSGLGDTVKWGIAAVAAAFIVPKLFSSTNTQAA